MKNPKGRKKAVWMALTSLPLVVVLLLAPGKAQASAEARPAAADPALEARVLVIASELRCLVCQNESIAASNAPLALDLRAQVREQLRAGRTPEQIHAYMAQRYGDFVFYRPPLRPGTVLLWTGPFVLLGLGGLALLRHLGRRAARKEDVPSPAELRRALRLLDGAAPEAGTNR